MGRAGYDYPALFGIINVLWNHIKNHCLKHSHGDSCTQLQAYPQPSLSRTAQNWQQRLYQQKSFGRQHYSMFMKEDGINGVRKLNEQSVMVMGIIGDRRYRYLISRTQKLAGVPSRYCHRMCLGSIQYPNKTMGIHIWINSLHLSLLLKYK